MEKKNLIEFSGRVVRNVYNSPDFKIYALDVDQEKYPEIKRTKYGNAAICGNLHELGEGLEYNITAEETLSKNGYSYKVVNINRDKPKSAEEMYVFLQEILTRKQAEVLYNVYPDIVQRVINNDLDDIDLSKTKGIKEYTFNVIKKKIIDNYALAEVITEFKGLLSLSMVKKLYEKYPSINVIRSEMRKSPYKCLCELSGVGFLTADALLLEFERNEIITFDYDLKTSKERCAACVAHLLSDNENNGNTRMDIRELRKQVAKMTPACSDKFVEAVKDDSIYYNKEDMTISLRSTYEKEVYIAEEIKKALKIDKKWDINTDKYKVVNGSELSEEQQRVPKMVCENQISILNGFGGCGKSFTTQSVINMCKDNNKTFKLFSPTGKAAKVLGNYTKEAATTIHRGLEYNPGEGWGYNKECKLLCDVLIIDEFSMTDIDLFVHVIDAINFDTTKLLIIGDSAQISSVGCGNLLHDFINSGIIPIVTLTKVFRYAEGGLSKVATDIRNSVKYLKGLNNRFTYFGNKKDYAFLNIDSSSMMTNIVALYKKITSKEYQENHGLNLKITDVQVLTAKNIGDLGTVALNNELQKVANKNYSSNISFKMGDVTYFEGDLVMQTTNNYRAKLYFGDGVIFDDMYSQEDKDNTGKILVVNGETGIIKKINMREQYVVIDFDGTEVVYRREDMQQISLAYAISIHKSQGSSIPIVILVTPKSHTFMLNSNLLYVGVSRTSNICFHIGEADTVNMCVKKKDNLTRNTYMKDLLLN